ncbi:MAG: hypothetical protein ACXABK_00215 [Candidatus Heimdallarchaeaceae archaeon]
MINAFCRIMRFLNYFDIPEEELKSKDVKEYVYSIYKELNAPEGRIRSIQFLPHEDKKIRRVCAIYETIYESIEKIENVR